MSSPLAIVVGAGTGVGQATALTLHRAGLIVVAVDRTKSA
jgi:NAD(P)-dependent dehydrogenase (short-subunit alcohol dehydrogenase family)